MGFGFYHRECGLKLYDLLSQSVNILPSHEGVDHELVPSTPYYIQRALPDRAS
jgi:hypothetical protein